MNLRLVTLGVASFLLLAAGLLSSAPAEAARVRMLTHSDVVQGLGERFPNARDVSKSDNFRVYEFKKDGITYVQLNALDGEILAAVGVTRDYSFALPLGTMPTSQVVTSQRTDKATVETAGAATCPCSAQVVYDGPNATIVVIYGYGGEVIQVITILKHPERQ